MWQLEREIGHLEHRDAGCQGQVDGHINQIDVEEGMPRHHELKRSQGQRGDGMADVPAKRTGETGHSGESSYTGTAICC